MNPDNLATCTYRHHVDRKYSIELHFASVEAAKTAALSLLRFLGIEPQGETQQEAPTHKPCEEVAEEADLLTQAHKNEMEFSDMLRVYRVAHGYSQRTLAGLLGTTQSNICHWENGTFAPHARTQQAIRNKLESGEFNA